MKKNLCHLVLGWAAFVLPVSVACADADAAKGQKLFARCSACHTTTDQNKVGPGLADVVGRAAGTVGGYSYSPAMKSSGLTWDDATLDAFLKSPGTVVKGTRMSISIPKDEDRADVIAYLKTLTVK